MLSVTDQIQLVMLRRKHFQHLLTRLQADGAQENIQDIIQDIIVQDIFIQELFEDLSIEDFVEGGGIAFDGRVRAAGSDAGFFPLAADVAASRARGRDAAVPSLAAPARPDRAAMAHPSGTRRGRDDPGPRTRPGCVFAGAEPVAGITWT